ncbi:MAG: protein kinase domain-containing protein, partial [Planctomycetota bacterium]
RAYHPQLKRTVALKVLIAGEDASDEAIARFHREAEAVAKLGHHPNIVPVYDIGAEGNLHYFAMHFVEGKPLDGVIDDGEIAPKRAAVIAKKLAEALGHAHVHGVLHRDVKPANVLVTPEGEPQLTDFGLAKDVHAESGVTRSGMTLGTPVYMPPEQADGRLDGIDERSDVYSLGATLYEMLAFKPPFEGATPVEVIRKVILEDPVSPRKANSLVEKDLETICLKCLAKEPDRRYGSAGDLAQDLGRFLEGKPIQAKPASLGYLMGKMVRRHKGLFAAVMTFLVLLAAGGVVAIRMIQAEARETEREKEKAHLADRKRRDAERKEAEATRRKEKNAKVSAVLLMAYAKLGDMHRELKGNFFSELLSRDEQRDLFRKHERRLQEFCDATARDPASRSTMFAVKAWLYRLGRFREESQASLREARKADPEVAWAHLFEAMGWLARYMVEQPWPHYVSSRSGVTLSEMPQESEKIRFIRREFEGVIRRVNELQERAAGEGADGLVMAEEKEAFDEVFSGFQAMYEGDFPRAERGLTAALKHWSTAWLEEEVLLARSKLRYLLEDFSGGIEDALEFRRRCPGSLSISINLSLLYRSQAVEQLRCGEDPHASLGKSIEACTDILHRQPRHAAALVSRGTSYKSLADAEGIAGKDPRRTLHEAIRDFTEALRWSPGLLLAMNGRGNAYGRLGEAEASRGGNGKKWFLLALEEHDECVRRAPENSYYFNNRGITYDSLAEAAEREGGDPRPLYQRAIADYKNALKLNPDFFETINNRGYAYMNLGEAQRARGVDPMDAFRKALQDCNRMVQLDPEYSRAYWRRAEVLLEMGETLEIRGEDPREHIQRALADCREALKRKGHRRAVLKTLGGAYRSLAETQQKRNVDPREAFRLSIESYDG